jgi:hypothetical protein
MKFIWQTTFSLVVIIFFGACLRQATAGPRQAKFFPVAILVPMILVGVINLALPLKGSLLTDGYQGSEMESTIGI